MNKYPLKDEPGKSMVVFEKAGQYYGHIIKEKTEKAPAKFVFETQRYGSLELLKADYPSAE
ncbi:MAG: hypothetical protein K0R75_3076 [Paenibacillaceae bacterium]|nr:hypothetical protein [Paenibacillaceae bacterium]